MCIWGQLQKNESVEFDGKIYTSVFYAAIYLTMILNLVFYEDAKIAFTTGVLTTGGEIREYAICGLMYLITLVGIWTLIMYTKQYFNIRRRALIAESNMPEGLSKVEQKKWLERYKAQQRTLKILAKQGK